MFTDRRVRERVAHTNAWICENALSTNVKLNSSAKYQERYSPCWYAIWWNKQYWQKHYSAFIHSQFGVLSYECAMRLPSKPQLCARARFRQSHTIIDSFKNELYSHNICPCFTTWMAAHNVHKCDTCIHTHMYVCIILYIGVTWHNAEYPSRGAHPG